MSKHLPFLGEITEHVRFCLVRESPAVESAVRLSCGSPDDCTVFDMDGLLTDQNTLSRQGEQVVHAAAASEVVLVEWKLEHAPLINTLGFHLRRGHYAPLVALCRGGQEEWIPALATAADYATSFPLNLPLLRACATAYQRLAQAVEEERLTPAAAPEADAAADEPAEHRHNVLRYGELKLDRTAHRFYIRESEVELTPREFALLEFLIENAGTALTRDQILDDVWGINFDTGTNMVDVYMYFLRRKLEANGVKGIIQTVRGYGYRLAGLEPAES